MSFSEGGNSGSIITQESSDINTSNLLGSSGDDGPFKDPQVNLTILAKNIRNEDVCGKSKKEKKENQAQTVVSDSTTGTEAGKEDEMVKGKKHDTKDENGREQTGNRKKHKDTEKKRREKINKLIDELTAQVPMCRNSPYKLDKLTVLKMTVFHLKMLQQKRAAEGILSPFKPLNVQEDEMRVLLEQAANGFLLVLTSEKGQILYISDVVRDVIGYSASSMIGRSLYNMISSRDVSLVKEQIKPTGSVPSVNSARAARLLNEGRQKPEIGCIAGSRRSFFCRFRATEKGSAEMPTGFQLVEKVEIKGSNKHFEDGNFFVPVFCTGFLKTWQVADRPLYDVPDDMDLSTSTCFIGIGRAVQSVPFKENIKTMNISPPTNFTSRHSADAKFLYVDSSVAMICGFLPQDLVGQSEYDYVHHDDVIVLADVFKKVVHLREQEKVASKMYRAKVKGGGLIRMRTVAFSVFNPYSQELEYIVHKNYVCDNITSYNSKTMKTKGSDFGKNDCYRWNIDKNKQGTFESIMISDADATDKEKEIISNKEQETIPWTKEHLPIVVCEPSLMVSTSQPYLNRTTHVVSPANGHHPSCDPGRESGAVVYALANRTSDNNTTHLSLQSNSFEHAFDAALHYRNASLPLSPYVPAKSPKCDDQKNCYDVSFELNSSEGNSDIETAMLSREANENVLILATTALALHENGKNSESTPNKTVVPVLRAEPSGGIVSNNAPPSPKLMPAISPKCDVSCSSPYDNANNYNHDNLYRQYKNVQDTLNVLHPEAEKHPLYANLLSFIQASVGKAMRESLPFLLDEFSEEAKGLPLSVDSKSHCQNIQDSSSLPLERNLDNSGSRPNRLQVAPQRHPAEKSERVQPVRETSVISCVGKCTVSDSSSISSESSDTGSSSEEEKQFDALSVGVNFHESCGECQIGSPYQLPSMQLAISKTGRSLLYHTGANGIHTTTTWKEHSESSSSSPEIMLTHRKRKRFERKSDSNSSNKSSPRSLYNDSGNESEFSKENVKRKCRLQSIPDSPMHEKCRNDKDGDVAHLNLPSRLQMPFIFSGANESHNGDKPRSYSQMVGSVENVLRDHLLGGVAYAGRQCDTGHLAARIMSILGINGLPEVQNST